MTNNFRYLLCFVFSAFFVLAICSAAFAEGPSADALLLQARQAAAENKGDAAIAALEALRRQYPGVAGTMNGDVLLYGLYLGKHDAAHAAAIYAEVLKLWPHSDAAWRVIVADCDDLAQKSPAAALAALDKATQANLPPLSAHYAAMALRVKYLQVASPDTFLAEGMKVMERLPTITDIHDIGYFMEIAERLYGPLMAVQRFDDARTMADALNQKLLLLGDPGHGSDYDTMAYLDALAKADQTRYLAAIKPLINAVAWAGTAAEFQHAIAIAQKGYPCFMRAGRFDDAQQLHRKIQLALALKPDLQNLSVQDIDNYVKALKAADEVKFEAAIQASLNTVKTAQTAADLLEPIAVAGAGYTGLCDAHKVEEVKARHQEFLAAFTRLGAGSEPRIAELFAYGDAMQSILDNCYLPEAIPFVQTIDKADVKDIYQISMLADERYMPEFAITTSDILLMYEKVDTALAKAKMAGMQTWNCARIEWLMKSSKKLDEQAVIARAASYAKTLNADAGTYQLRYASALAVRAYATLLSGNQFSLALLLHEQLAGLFGKQADKTFSNNENQAYYAGLAQANPAQFIAYITMQVEHMALAGDANTARLSANAAAAGYAIVMQTKTVAAAKAMHEKIQTGLQRFNLMPEMRSDTQAYLIAMAGPAPDEFLLLAAPRVAGIAMEKDADACKADATLAALMYQPLARKEQGDAALILHQSVQTALVRLRLTDEVAIDDDTYLNAMLASCPANYVSEALPRAQAIQQATTHDELIRAFFYAQYLYAPMMTLGRFDDVKLLHDQVQLALAKFNLKDDAKADAAKYKDSFSSGALDALLALYKRALANDDNAQAKRWLGQLNAIAPESPQAMQARMIARTKEPDSAVK